MRLRLSALDIKAWRDVRREAAQLLAIVSVLACGVAVFVGMRSTMKSLDKSRRDYYAAERFADVFATCKRAPDHVSARLRAIPGVRVVETRAVAFVTLDVPQIADVVTAQIVSLPEHRPGALNRVVLRAGRMPRRGAEDEVLVHESFVQANDLNLGTELTAILNGHRQTLRVVGVALSPEFVWALPPGSVFPDEHRFGVLWMSRAPLAAAFDLRGAFNDVSIGLGHAAREQDVLKQVDAVLRPFGGTGAISRKDQTSAFFVANELDQLRTMTWSIPVLFLAVSAFLLHVVLGRIVAGQRESIAALGALGYHNGELGRHFAKVVALVVFAGCAVGVVFGAWIASWMTEMYSRHYRFPSLPVVLSFGDVLLASSIAAVSGVAGAVQAIRNVVTLPPAEAMRPVPPVRYRPTVIERLGLTRYVPVWIRIVLRELERKPLRALLSMLGIAMAGALTVVNAFMLDSMRTMLAVQFSLIDRADVRVALTESRGDRVLRELEHLPGVRYAEGILDVPIELASGSRRKRTVVTGLSRDSELQVLRVGVGSEGIGSPERFARVPIPPEGIVLSRTLAQRLRASVGDVLRMDVLAEDRGTYSVPVAQIVDSYVGMTAHMDRHALCRLLGRTPCCNSASLLVDDGAMEQLAQHAKQTPGITGVSSGAAVLASMTKILDENIGVYVMITIFFSLVLAFGVLYNSVRVTLAERTRDLASLRVLGFRRREVAAILFGEIAVLVVVAIPLGLWIGYGLAALLVSSPGFDSEQFRLPLVIGSRTWALSIATIALASALSCWLAWRRLDSINIVEVLKTRD